MSTPHEIILDGYVYDLTAFTKVHPGGSQALNIFPHNQDITIHYYMLHSRPSKKLLEPYKLRKADTAVADTTIITNSLAFEDLKRRVNKEIKYQFATVEWYIKAVVILVIAMYLEYANLIYGYTYIKSSCLGVMFALIGLCIQHDANHGAVSYRYPILNTIFGYTQDWIGGSAILWKHHHVLLHHAYTNIRDQDPDITTDIIRLHKMTKWNRWYSFQAIYVWFLLPLLPLNWHFKEISDLLNMNHMGHAISVAAANEVRLSLILRLLFILRFYIIPIYYYPSLYTLSCLLLTLGVGGLYLGVNFIISHNFENTYVPDKDDEDWCFVQIKTSSTVGGRLLGFFHGGLNYQIEHHLFPKICHVHYHKLQPIVQQWCKDYNLPYTYFPRFIDNIRSCYKHLNMIGNEE